MEEFEIEKAEQLEMVILDNSRYVYKSHNLIESGYNLTLNEQRLIYLATKKLKPIFIKNNIKPSEIATLYGHSKFKDITIYVNEFKSEFQLSSNNLYKVLEDTAKKLKTKEIKYLQDNGEYVEKYWVITSKYNEKEKYIKLTFHPDLVLDLLVFKTKFGRLDYEGSKAFRSSYTFRLYELLQNFAYKKTREIDLQELRYKLGIFEDDKYSRYSDFDSNVIAPSVKVINKNTDLKISYKGNRVGRKIGKMTFTITKKDNFTFDDNECQDMVDMKQVEKMNNITGQNLTSGEVAMITDATLESIKENNIDMRFYELIEYEVEVLKQYNEHTPINNYCKTLCKAISQFWQINKPIEKMDGKSNIKFNNFKPRNIDYDGLERKLLGWED